jgi:hypothetical protein
MLTSICRSHSSTLGLDGGDGHDAGVVHQDVDAVEGVDRLLDEGFHFSALRDVGGEGDDLAAGCRDLPGECVDPVLAPGSQDEPGSASREKLGRAFSDAAARSRDDDDLVCNS